MIHLSNGLPELLTLIKELHKLSIGITVFMILAKIFIL